MTSIVIEYQIPEGQSKGDAFDAARELIAVEDEKNPDAVFGEPVWQDTSTALFATVVYEGELSSTEPDEEETPQTCVATKKNGEACGRKYPCFYHPTTTLKTALTN